MADDISRWSYVTPLCTNISTCLNVGNVPSQGLVSSLDEDIVLKMAFQDMVPAALDSEAEFYRDRSLQSLVCMEREHAVYTALAKLPHPNIIRSLGPLSATYLCLERVVPLELVWAQANQRTRDSWIGQLLAAICWIEELGFTHGDLAIRNMGIDSLNNLKLFDFGSATSKGHADYAIDVKRDYSGLATCLHFLLTGIDPSKTVQSVQDVQHLRRTLLSGYMNIDNEALLLKDIIQAGWTETIAMPFAGTRGCIQNLMGSRYTEISLCHPQIHYDRFESRWKALAEQIPHDRRWKDGEEYTLAWRARGYEADLDIWR